MASLLATVDGQRAPRFKTLDPKMLMLSAGDAARKAVGAPWGVAVPGLQGADMDLVDDLVMERKGENPSTKEGWIHKKRDLPDLSTASLHQPPPQQLRRT